MTARTLETVIREANAAHGPRSGHVGEFACACGHQSHIWAAWRDHQAAEVAKAVREWAQEDAQVEVAARCEVMVRRGVTGRVNDTDRSAARQSLAAVLGGDGR